MTDGSDREDCEEDLETSARVICLDGKKGRSVIIIV